jgi:CRP-like cAMP-binding protein
MSQRTTSASHRSRNHLLSVLSPADFRLLEPNLEATELGLRRVLEHANKPIKQVYFMEAGIASVVTGSGSPRQIEVGIVGREGMTGISVVMGDNRWPHQTYMQVAGRGQRMKADDLRRAMEKSSSLRDCFLHFVQAFMLQTAHTATSNGRANIEQRLARWLLMAHDRVSGNELPLTHEFLALMLCVRRAGVTVAIQSLENSRLLSAKRGLIVIIDRAGLKAVAAGFYGVPEAEYRRLNGWRPEHR